MFNTLLTSFVCVADSGSFNKAARKLFVSSTAVIKQINSLEKHLGFQVFQRTNHGITLTLGGKIIYKHAKLMFEYSERAIEEARQAIDELSTVFCVGTSILNPSKPFMDIWYQVNIQFPGYRLHIIPFEDSHGDILSEISALGQKFDFLVAACDSKLWLNRCNFYQLGSCQQCIAVPREHRLSKNKVLTISDLYGEKLMMVKRGDSITVDQIRDEIEKHPSIQIEDTFQFYDMEVFNRCVHKQNIMLTLDCWIDVHPSLVTIPVEWEFTIPYGILYQLHPDKTVLRFLDTLKNSL